LYKNTRNLEISKNLFLIFEKKIQYEI
jgi:hypothetical protein